VIPEFHNGMTLYARQLNLMLGVLNEVLTERLLPPVPTYKNGQPLPKEEWVLWYDRINAAAKVFDVTVSWSFDPNTFENDITLVTVPMLNEYRQNILALHEAIA
jgi:hypothetical protein